MDTLPASIRLSTGELHVTFKTVDQQINWPKLF
jgi:hypothetical protein